MMAFLTVGHQRLSMTDADRIKALEANLAQLRAEVADLTRTIENIANAIRPVKVDGGQRQITRWMGRDEKRG